MSGLSVAALFARCVPWLLAVSLAQAAVLEVPVKPGDRLFISVPEAVINLQSTPGNSKTVKINLADSAQEDFTIQTLDGRISIVPKDPPRKDDFGQKPASNKRRLIEISGAALPIEIHAFEAQVQFTHWSREALVHIQKGRIVSKDGSGTFRAHSQSGDILVSDHQGPLVLDTYKANLTVKNHLGDMDLENFSGESVVEKSKGFLSFNQGMGQTKVLTSSGNLQFDLTKGSISVQNFQGRVEGQTQEGQVNIQMASDSDVNLKSKSGKINVSSAPGSGAALNVTNQDGDIFAPSYLHVAREGGLKALKGHFKGESAKGSLVIHSQDGVINVR